MNRLGYRVGEPQVTNAKALVEFEVEELGNEHLLVDVGKALQCEPNLEAIKTVFDKRFGVDAEAMWLCDTPEWAEKRYGPGEAYEVEIPSDAIVLSDLGPDGKLWIWRKPGSNSGTVFVEVRMLKDVPPITGSDMKTYGPFRKGCVYAIPKANARVFLKHGVAVATRKEAEKPTLKELFKGEVLNGYVEAAKVKPFVEEEEEMEEADEETVKKAREKVERLLEKIREAKGE